MNISFQVFPLGIIGDCSDALTDNQDFDPGLPSSPLVLPYDPASQTDGASIVIADKYDSIFTQKNPLTKVCLVDYC